MMGFLGRALWGFAALALCQAVTQAQTVPLTGDAYILPGSGVNVGAAATVSVGGAQGYLGLFQFDLSKLPPGVTAANVASASLRLFVNKVGSPGTINLYAANVAWTEGTVNGLSGLAPGALAAGPVSVTTANSYLAIPVTALVQSWVSGASAYGILIQASSTTSVGFESKESTATSHPAVLEIVLAPPAGPSGPAGATGPAGPTGVTGPAGASPKGDTGVTGAQGLAGAQGPQGVVGPQGPTGTAGTAGAQGLAGAAGATGPAGLAGPAGAAGTAGAQGLAGEAGPVGATGPAGFTGAAGAPGAAGAAGPAGAILNSFTISPEQPAGTISSSLTQNVILVNNTSAGNAQITLPSAGPGTAGKDVWIVGNDFTTNGNTFDVLAASGDEIIVHNAVFLNLTSFPINYRLHVISDGNHRWFPVQWD